MQSGFSRQKTPFFFLLQFCVYWVLTDPKKWKLDRQRPRWNQKSIMTLLTPGLGASPAEDAAPGCQAPDWTLAGPAFPLLKSQEWDRAMPHIYKCLYQCRKLPYTFCPMHCRKWTAPCPLGDAGRWAGAPVGVAPEVQSEECFCCYLPPAVGHTSMNKRSFHTIFSCGRLFHIFSTHVRIPSCLISWSTAAIPVSLM